MQKKQFTSSGKRQLKVFSQMMQMKFKPRSNTATSNLVQKNKQLLERQRRLNNNESELSRSTVSRMVNRDKKLKYLFSLSPEYFIVGNENQIDMIAILGIAHSFVDTDYCWSLIVPGSIDLLAIQTRKSLMAIVSDKKLYFYKYNFKRSKEIPELIKEFDIKPDVKYIQFPKDSLLGLFYQRDFQIYNVEQHRKIYKKCAKPYNEPKSFVLFAVPQCVENSLKVFFIEDDDGSKTFGLWFAKINLEFTEIQVQKPQKVYDIKRNLKKQLVVQNFSKDIVFMNIGAEILAAKNGYILDSANVNIQSGNAKLKYISNQRLIHISDKKLQIYKMSILTNLVPNKIQVIPIDALQINDKPHEAEFFGIVSTLGDNFAVFYQNISQFNIFTKGQASYWFVITESIPLEEKIRKIFDYGVEISRLNPETLEEKCDMARKMGLTEKQLYLELWNRSSKNSIEDYQFILATRNYKTIHTQIEKKLKKESMSFRQLLKIEESCLAILKEGVYGPKCTEENIQQFLTSHCFIKKLKLFKDIELYRKQIKKSTIKTQEQEENNKLLINIQQYYEYKDFDIKNYLVQKIVDFCVYDKDTKNIEIRMMLRSFKFIYRVIYKELLEEIIKLCKGKLVTLLDNIPEILPFAGVKTEQQLKANEELTLYEGIWGDIKGYQWERNIFIQNISTIDNKDSILQFVKSIWYRRYWLTAHELINLTKDKILEINQINNSELIFYFFISKVFELIPDEQTQFEIIYFLEQHYSLIPEHLKGKIFLYFNLHKFYKENHYKAKLPPLRLDEFLNLNDAQLFEYFFSQEKHTKNCILKSIKVIYEETCEQGEGLNLFNQGLLAYFKSPLSQISDLKYLLNRMNNEKTQFHQANLSIYEVLVRAMQYKLKLGSSQDIPIDEVLIYIQNIPISRDNEVMEQLEIVNKINEEAERFKKMKINMTIKQIIDNCEDVVSKIVQYEFETKKIRKIRTQKELVEESYKILAEVQVVKEKIYGTEKYVTLPFFIYLTKLLEEIEQIKFAKVLLADQFIGKYFPSDTVMTENLVLYMYKWIFSKDPTFIKNSEYIKQLVTLLPQNNQNRQFIQNETLFAIALSTPGDALQYPISVQTSYPRIYQLQEIIKYLPIEHVLKVDIHMIYESMKTMEEITLRQILKEEEEMGISTVSKVTQHEVFSVFVQKVIDQNHLNDAIPLIKKILKYEIPKKRYNTIFFIMLIQKLSTELNDESRNVMIKMISYCYDEPEKLFDFIEYYFTSKQIPLDKGKKLKEMMDQYTKGKVNFCKNNILFNAQSKQALAKPDIQENSKKLLDNIGRHLRQTKFEFQFIQFDLLFSILCNEPYLAAKYIQTNLFSINLKNMRSYLSYIIQESVFDERSVIEFSKRIFAMILESNVKRKDISKIIFNEDKFSFSLPELKVIGIDDDIDRKLEKTYKSFEKKKRSLLNMETKKASSHENQQLQIHLQLKNPDQLSSKEPSQYPFQDSDNQPGEEQIKSPVKIAAKRRKKQIQPDFNSKNERNKLMKRKNSFFGEKSSQNRSRNSINDQQMQESTPVTKSLSLQVPQRKPTKIYVKRTLTNENPAITKKNFSAITQKQESNSDNLSRLNKLVEKKQSITMNLNVAEQSKISKQESQYSIHEISEVQQQQASYRIKQLILQNYDMIQGKIDFDVLSKQESHEEFFHHLKDVLLKIFEDHVLDNNQKLKIIRLISQKYHKLAINQIYLAVYDNIQKIEEKYQLGLPIDRLLPFEGLFIQSKVLDDLFKLILPRVIEISTDQTIYKLSKLISLGFRKNIYEAEISFEYIKKMIAQFQSQPETQVQLNMRLEIIKSLLTKLSILALKEKAPKLIEGIIANPTLIQKIIAGVVQNVRKRGDVQAASEIQRIMEKDKQYK